MSAASSLYDFTGWIDAALEQPPSDTPIWIWSRDSYAVSSYTAQNGLRTGFYWRLAKVPLPPRLRTADEIEQEAILAAWRGQSLDFAEHRLSDIPTDFIRAWRAGRDWEKQQSRT